MKTLTIGVASQGDVTSRTLSTFKGKRQNARLSFASPELLFTLMTERRWQLLRALTGAGPMSLREAARRVQRDVKQVHGDVHALLNAGVLSRNEEGMIEFPYEAVHVDFVVKSEAA